MRITVLHNAVALEAQDDELDVLVQVEAVTAALRQLGHEPRLGRAPGPGSLTPGS